MEFKEPVWSLLCLQAVSKLHGSQWEHMLIWCLNSCNIYPHTLAHCACVRMFSNLPHHLHTGIALSWPTNTTTTRRAHRQRDSRYESWESRMQDNRNKAEKERQHWKQENKSNFVRLFIVGERSLSIATLSWRRISLHVRVYRLLAKLNMFGDWISLMCSFRRFSVRAFFVFFSLIYNQFVLFIWSESHWFVCKIAEYFRPFANCFNRFNFSFRSNWNMCAVHFYRALITCAVKINW